MVRSWLIAGGLVNREDRRIFSGVVYNSFVRSLVHIVPSGGYIIFSFRTIAEKKDPEGMMSRETFIARGSKILMYKKK